MRVVQCYRVESWAEGWFWARKVEACLSCHCSMEDNDYIFVHEFEEKLNRNVTIRTG